MTLLESLHAALVAAGIENCYMLEAPDIPECVTIAPYASAPDSDLPISAESFQIAVRNEDYADGNEIAWLAFRALADGRPDGVFSIIPRQSPTYLGREEKRHLFVFNFDAVASWERLGE